MKRFPSRKRRRSVRGISAALLCYIVMQSVSDIDATMGTEGVGFEPTVGFPTLDFESSALNRTQPPFRDEKRTSNPRTPKASAWQALNVQHPTSNTSMMQTIRSARRQWLAIS